MPDRPTYLGTVQDVRGAAVTVALDQSTVSGLSFVDGRGYRIGQLGSLARIPIGLVDLFGIVSQVGAGAVPEKLMELEPHGHRWLTLQLIGEGTRTGGFQRGITHYPTIADEVHLVEERDLARVYYRPDSPKYVRIGSIAGTDSIAALLDINRLVTRHSAVVGTTGAGKSTTVAGLLSALTNPTAYPSARALVVDIHGEYPTALRDRANVFRINADPGRDEQPLHIPYWALNVDEMLSVTPFRGVQDTERAALIQKVRELKESSLRRQPRDGVTEHTLTAASPIPFSIHRLWFELYRAVCSTHTAPPANQSTDTEAIAESADGNPLLGNMMAAESPTYRPITSGGTGRVYLSGVPLQLRRQLMAFQATLKDSRYDFLFRPGPWGPVISHEDLDAQPAADLDLLLRKWLGGDKPITILDLSGVPTSILTDLVGVVLRMVFDALFWARAMPEGGRARPLLVVLEEAHAYLNGAASNRAIAAASRLVKEGRKYGIGAMVVSQRPAEIDPTILSQCGTLFAMRLANSTDRGRVTAAASDSLSGLFEMLPALRTGEAIVVGESVHLPLRAQIDPPPRHRRPDSFDPHVFSEDGSSGWGKVDFGDSFERMVAAWRCENPFWSPDRGDRHE